VRRVDLNGCLKLDHSEGFIGAERVRDSPKSGRFCSGHPFTGLGTRAAGLNTSFHHLIVFRNPFTRVGAGSAYFCTHSASPEMKIGRSKEEVRARLANLSAVG
jgi:hypothetical protein